MEPVQNAPITNGTRVFVRADIDVPVENNTIQETFRLEKALPTLRFIIRKGGRPIICGHMKKDQSTKVLQPFFNEHLQPGTFELLENVRFDPREEANDPEFSKELAAKADIYVNESFATSHRAHASLVGVPKLLPSFAGLQLQAEIETLSKVIKNPEKPLVAVVGGAKLESKLPVISKFLSIAQAVLLGGKMGLEWKESVPGNLFIPKDYVDEKDIGPKTVEGYKEIIGLAKTIVWAGPAGVYEDAKYETGTKELAQMITATHAFTVLGGGDTIAAVNKFGLLDKFSFISTGGGAMLDFLAEGTLPALEAIGYHA